MKGDIALFNVLLSTRKIHKTKHLEINYILLYFLKPVRLKKSWLYFKCRLSREKCKVKLLKYTEMPYLTLFTYVFADMLLYLASVYCFCSLKGLCVKNKYVKNDFKKHAM